MNEVFQLRHELLAKHFDFILNIAKTTIPRHLRTDLSLGLAIPRALTHNIAEHMFFIMFPHHSNIPSFYNYGPI